MRHCSSRAERLHVTGTEKLEVHISASKITRRELLSAAGMMLGMSPAHIYGFASQHADTPQPAPVPATAKVRWTAEAANTLRNQQERAYIDLGKRMGIGSDPMTVYRAFTRERMPAERIKPDRYWETFGSIIKREDARGIPEAQIAEYLARYGDVQPPTRDEDPTLYAVLLEMSDAIEVALKSQNLPTPPRLLLGTMPTGTTTATRRVIQTADSAGHRTHHHFRARPFRFRIQDVKTRGQRLSSFRPEAGMVFDGRGISTRL